MTGVDIGLAEDVDVDVVSDVVIGIVDLDVVVDEVLDEVLGVEVDELVVELEVVLVVEVDDVDELGEALVVDGVGGLQVEELVDDDVLEVVG